MNETELREAIAYLNDCLRDIDQRAEGRALEGADQTSFDEGVAERNRLQAQLDSIVARRSAVAAAADNPAQVIDGDGATGAPNTNRNDDPFDLASLRFNAPGSEVRSRAMTALEGMPHLDDAHRSRATDLLERADTDQGDLARHILATGSTAYRTGWQKMIRGVPEQLTPEERSALAEARALSLTDANGGYAVPVTLDPTIIITNDGSTNPFRRIASQRSIVTSKWTGVTSAGVTAGFAAEATEVADGAPTLGPVSITPHKAHVFVPFSVEVEGDWAALEADVRDMIADGKDNLEATKFALGAGDGSEEPFGVVTALAAAGGSVIVAPTTAATFAPADIYKLEEALGARWLANASWLGNHAIFNKVRQFDTNGGSNMWERIGAAQPSELIGYPVHRSSAMDGSWNPAATAAHNYLLILGDFSRYRIIDRVGMSIELVPHLFGENGRPTGQRGFYAWWRVGGDVVVPNAFRMLDIPTTA